MEGEDDDSSPFLYSDHIYEWLENSLDYGITEAEFWNMTIGEVERAIASKKRVEKIKEKERAAYDYILADLIGKSVGRLYSSSNEMPAIYEAYPEIFNEKEIEAKRQERIAELSALRFKQFADSYNKRLKEVQNTSE